MGELRQTDNSDLDPRDIFNASFQPPGRGSLGSIPSPAGASPQQTMEAVIQMFREKTDLEIAVLIPGTSVSNAATMRSMLTSAGLL